MPWALQYSISDSRESSVHFSFLQAAMIFKSGARALMPSSKRIWSLPFPVAPWQIAAAPSLRAISTSFFAIRGLAMEVPRRYLFSYTAWACTQGMMYSSQNSSVTSSMYNFSAPQNFARSSRPSSSSPCPQSMQTQITS
ncbi:hypothetical protein IMSAG249_01955 [Lachnospiraceae bacterium]|nr:hypothetical protein IMSAG249_01955 [Lachnospiraceae bacterium]